MSIVPIGMLSMAKKLALGTCGLSRLPSALLEVCGNEECDGTAESILARDGDSLMPFEGVEAGDAFHFSPARRLWGGRPV